MTIGAVSYGAYIPWYRMERKLIYSAMGWLNSATYQPGEKAIANCDEDSITMAVAASIDCLDGFDRSSIDGVYFATTTAPYKERLNAEIIATALNLRADIQAVDFTGSTKAGTSALISACNAVKTGAARNILVCASDNRLGKPGGAQEEAFGDGAAALLLGEKDIIANLGESHSVSYDFMGDWRAADDKFNRAWEERWIRDEAYSKFIAEAIAGLAKKCNLDPKNVAKVCYPCLFIRDHPAIGKGLGLDAAQIQEPMFTTIGNTGAAYPLMLLVAALEDAKPKNNVIVASFGNGSDALLFQATERINEIRGRKKGIKKHLSIKNYLTSYEKYAAFRDITPVEKGIRGEEITATPVSLTWRNRKEILALCGVRCKRCGTPQYPSQLVCVNPKCKAIGEMEDYLFSDKKATVFSYTEDSLAFSISPPQLYAIVDFYGGGRYWFDVTDCESGTLKVGMPVEMSFRRKYVDVRRGIHSYFWKAVPVRDI